MNPTTFCGYFDRGECRSCSEIETDPRDQIAGKEARVRAELGLLSEPGEDFPIVPSARSRPTGFRNRAKLSVTGTSADPIVGLPGDEVLDLGRELLGCPIHHRRLNEILSALPGFIREFDLVPYRIAERKGELKGVILFHSEETGETYLRFVLRSRECVSRIRKGLPKLLAEFPDLSVVTANLQPVPHAILEGPEEIVLTESATLRHSIDGIPFRLSPRAFVQTNSAVARELYRTAEDWIGESGASRVAELYCGQGAFSFFAARNPGVRSVLGIDVNPEGISAANESARERGIDSIEFRSADASAVGEVLDRFSPDLVLVNPPRRGLGNTAGLLNGLSPREIVYSSCSLESLASDLRSFSGTYRLRRIRVFDLFPHTRHFETLVWITRRSITKRSGPEARR